VSWLARTLSRFNGSFDVVIIDTAPSLSPLHTLAIWAAHLVIVPASPRPLDSSGVAQVLNTMVHLKQERGWRGSLFGVLPTMYREGVREHEQVLQEYRQRFKERVLPVIHQSVRIAECPARGLTIFEHDPRSRAAREYALLVEQVYRALPRRTQRTARVVTAS